MLMLDDVKSESFSVVSDLSKILVNATWCCIFLYNEQDGVVISKYSDFEDEDTMPLDSETIYRHIMQKSPYLCDSYLAYPILNKDTKSIGVILLFKKKKGYFNNNDLLLVKPMAYYLSNKVIDIEQEELSKPNLSREIVLALYLKDENIGSIVRENLKNLGDNTLFEFDIFAKLNNNIKDQREKTFILICTVSNIEQINEIGLNIEDTNLTAIVIGPDDDDMILEAGKCNFTSYIPKSKYTKELINKKILDNFHNIIKRKKNESFLNLFIGTTGGTGTTTITTNLANVLSMTNPHKNVLYLDLSTTKAISNIFFGLATPKKTIVDFLDIDDYSEESMLNSGLYQIKNNLYVIPGIQSHMDREDMIDQESERKIINMLYQLKSIFNFIIIDGGLAKDSGLQIAIEEITDQISIVTELTTIHISILQTYYELMKKAGWRDKVKIIINRENSQNAISLKDASEILNSHKSKDITFDIHIPNDGSQMRECWNFGKLVTSEYPNSSFSKAIKNSNFFSDLDMGLMTKTKKPTLIEKIFGKS